MASLKTNIIVKKIKILIVNGPNLNLTGVREPHIYGSESFNSLVSFIETLNKQKPDVEATLFHSNHEGEIIDVIHKAGDDDVNGIIINPGGFTHTSVGIADALRSVRIPAVEVHLSNIYSREEYRRYNLIASACIGCISGLGIEGYRMALGFFMKKSE